jgi:hypothetical protein
VAAGAIKGRVKGSKQRFFEKKRAKNFYESWALAAPTPTIHKSFLVLFFKKEPLPSI